MSGVAPVIPMVPVIPESAPFSPEQRAWLNGYFAGLFARGPVDPVATAAKTSQSPQSLRPLTVLFGSQTGTAEALAKRAAKEAGKRGFAAIVMDLSSFTLAQLAQEKNVVVIVSTYGDGEPPDGVKPLHASLAAAPASALTALRFSVCALGDTNYPLFCQCGKDFDSRLEKLGGHRVALRVDCDLDFEESFVKWLSVALASLGAADGPTGPGTATQTSAEPMDEEASKYTKANPFAALLTTSRNLNGPDSAKQVHHVEFDLADSGLAYQAGDALGVYPLNCPNQVAEVLAALGSDGEEAVPAPDGSSLSLRRALTECYDLGKPSAELLACCPASTVGNLLVSTHHVVDVLLAHPGPRLEPATFVRALKKLQPRLYSISSSPRAHPRHVHLTVGAVRYEKDGRERHGVCSTFLADRVTAASTRVRVFVHANKAFRPPAALTTPMIMVGPGTGIAPFRAFLQERRAAGGASNNWLFFGDQRASSDFLYREELTELRANGCLTRLDLAFSRDQPEKIYVQQRMLENAAELFAWLEAGAHFYVCGDAARMAKDVDQTLHEVIQRAGQKTAEAAASYVQSLRLAKRYQRDVY